MFLQNVARKLLRPREKLYAIPVSGEPGWAFGPTICLTVWFWQNNIAVAIALGGRPGLCESAKGMFRISAEDKRWCWSNVSFGLPFNRKLMLVSEAHLMIEHMRRVVIYFHHSIVSRNFYEICQIQQLTDWWWQIILFMHYHSISVDVVYGSKSVHVLLMWTWRFCEIMNCVQSVFINFRSLLKLCGNYVPVIREAVMVLSRSALSLVYYSAFRSLIWVTNSPSIEFHSFVNLMQ